MNRSPSQILLNATEKGKSDVLAIRHKQVEWDKMLHKWKYFKKGKRKGKIKPEYNIIRKGTLFSKICQFSNISHYKVLTVKEISICTGYSLQKIYKDIKKGKLNPIFKNGIKFFGQENVIRYVDGKTNTWK